MATSVRADSHTAPLASAELGFAVHPISHPGCLCGSVGTEVGQDSVLGDQRADPQSSRSLTRPASAQLKC